MGNNKIKVGKCGRSIVHNNHLYYDESKRGVQVCYGVNPGSIRAIIFGQVGGTDEATEWPRFAWPGGYDIAYVTNDGGALCGACMNAESQVHFKDEDPTDDGWLVIGAESTDMWDEGQNCDHCNRWLGPDNEEDK